MGPDAYTAKEVVDEMNGKAGMIWQWGALDFAGGTVVHINAAVAGLVGAFMIGKRIGYGREAMTPHSLTLTMVGASLLWVGWFGFNAGSALEANGFAALAFVNTLLATAAAVLAWCVGEALMRGKASMLGAASGAVAGLVAITPAAGNVGIGGGLVIGIVAGFACLWGVNGLKKMLGADDTLDVFGVHGVGGVVGALLTGVFNSPALGGPGFVADWTTATMVTAADYSIAAQVWTQAKAVLVTIVWSGVVSLVAFKLVDLTVGLRVSEEAEREGLDITSHGERRNCLSRLICKDFPKTFREVSLQVHSPLRRAFFRLQTGRLHRKQILNSQSHHHIAPIENDSNTANELSEMAAHDFPSRWLGRVTVLAPSRKMFVLGRHSRPTLEAHGHDSRRAGRAKA
ncbi:MAG: Ammonia channel precursor [Pseudomonadota bacterium]